LNRATLSKPALGRNETPAFIPTKKRSMIL
jgi:hypothetical protein